MVRITYKVHDITIPQANDPTKTVSKTVYESETHHAETGMIGFPGPDRTIATGKVIILDSLTTLRGEGAAADALDFIEFGATPEIADKDLVWVQQGAEAITLNHNTSTPPSNSGPLLLLSKANKKMIGVRMVLLQRQGTNFQEIAFDGTIGNGGILVEDDSGNAIIVCGSVASAVNHLKVTNAATGNNVILEPIGSDSDIGFTLSVKGNGKHIIGNSSINVAGILGFPSTAVEIATGVLAGTSRSIIAEAETGTADIIDTVTGFADGDQIAIVADASDLITITHDVGGNDSIHLAHKINIFLSEKVPLILERRGLEWYEIAGPLVEPIVLALHAPDVDTEVKDALASFPTPFKGKIIKVKANVETVSSSGLPTFALRNLAGTDILSTNITIDVSEKTSETAVTPPVIKSDGTEIVAEDDRIQVDCDVAGTGTTGDSVTVWVENISDE